MVTWHRDTLLDQHQALADGRVSPEELLEYYLERIERFNPDVHALVHLDPDAARSAAHEATRRIAVGNATPLTGLPTADKDLVARAGMPTRYGSAVTAGAPTAEASDPMALWLDQVGAVSVGKTTTSEFGMAAATEALAVGPTRNPHDLTRSAGGSSGGAAAAVAAGMLPFAPGSDGGGSIRIPALSCGLVGWKPSRGLIPAGSGFEFLGGLAVPGLITRSVADLALAADLMVEGSWGWATRAPGRPGGYFDQVSSPRPPARIGLTTATPWPAEWGIAPSDDALVALDAAKQALVEAGHEVVEFDWSPTPSYADDFVTLWTANAAALPVPPEQVSQLEPLTQFLIERGQQVSAVELVRALGGLRRFEFDTITAFSSFDAVLTPGLSSVAPEIGWYDQGDAWRNFRQQVEITPWTSFVNVAGLPAIAVPTHYAGDLPLGVQLIGRAGGDGTIIGLAADIERQLPGATRWPAMVTD